MRKVYISNLEVGQRIGTAIHAHGKIIVTKGAVVSNTIINTLKENYIVAVPIIEDDDLVTKELSKIERIKDSIDYLKFQEKYLYISKTIEDTFDNISKGSTNLVKILGNKTMDFISESKISDVNNYLLLLKERDYSLYEHSLSVAILAYFVGVLMKMNDDELEKLVLVGIFHDIGEINLPKEIVDKKSPLTPEEKMIFDKHPMQGYLMLVNDNNLSKDVKLGIAAHHEFITGGGMPRGIKGSEINIYAQIIGIVENYDTNIRGTSYKSPITPFEAIAEIEESWMERYNGEIAVKFMNFICNNLLGCFVELSNGKRGEVVFIDMLGSGNRSKPIVKLESGELINLVEKKDVKIIKVY